MEDLLCHDFEVKYIKASSNLVADYLPRFIWTSAGAPDYSHQLRSYKPVAGFVRVLEDDDMYDYELLQMATKETDDIEYCALINAIKWKSLPTTTKPVDLSSYKSVLSEF